MSIRKLFAALASVAILGSTIAIFHSSAEPDISTLTGHAPAVAVIDGRPVVHLAPVTVVAYPLAQETRESSGNLIEAAESAGSGVMYGSSNMTSESQLVMPYYSFARNLHTLVKD